MKNILSLKKVAYWSRKGKLAISADTECSTECTATGCSIAGCGCGVECSLSCTPGVKIRKYLNSKTR